MIAVMVYLEFHPVAVSALDRSGFLIMRSLCNIGVTAGAKVLAVNRRREPFLVDLGMTVKTFAVFQRMGCPGNKK